MDSSSLSLDNCVLFELDKLTMGSLKKRIVNELVEFKNIYSYIDAEYKESINQPVIILTIALKKNDTIFQFYITKEYPFKPPIQFKINFKNYIDYLKIESQKTLYELRTFYNINCLCCNNIYCGDIKWSPMLKMQDFINEFKKIKIYRYEIIIRLLCKKILEKYLISDINLIEWLLYF
jgi:hypothetical protein